jgi:hypothetical protein
LFNTVTVETGGFIYPIFQYRDVKGLVDKEGDSSLRFGMTGFGSGNGGRSGDALA